MKSKIHHLPERTRFNHGFLDAMSDREAHRPSREYSWLRPLPKWDKAYSQGYRMAQLGVYDGHVDSDEAWEERDRCPHKRAECALALA